MKNRRHKPIAFLLFSYLFILGFSEPVFKSMAAEVPDSVKASGTEAVVNPGDSIELADMFTELDDIVISRNRKLVESDGAKLSYNVNEDPEAGNSSLLEILRKVPGISVDAEDNVRVNGQTSFKILMNGHEDPMLKGDLKTILKSLPAASILKIEVISEPGAKYDAEGIGGILNIVTDRKQSLSGFMTQVSGWVNSFQAGGYLNAKTKIDKVMFDATVNYNNGKVWPRSNRIERETSYLDSDKTERLKRINRSGWDYTGGNLNMSWEPDSLNLFTLSANYGYNSWNSRQNDSRSMTTDHETLWNVRQNLDSYGYYNFLGGMASYQHTFGKEGHNLIVSYEMDCSWMRYATLYNLIEQNGLLNEAPFSASRAKVRDISHILQIDYSNPLASNHILEAGMKININDNRSDQKSIYGESPEEGEADPSLTVDVTQFKDIYAAYASYSGSFDKWNIKGGVRYEHTEMGLKYRTAGYNNFRTVLNDIVPNAALSYNLTSASSLRLAYQMRISRPGLTVLNPYVNNLTAGWLSYGNPNLHSEKSHNVSFSYSNYEGKFGGSAKLSYEYVANGINDVIFIKDDVINATYANIGRQQEVSLELTGNWNITQNLNCGIYASGGYEYLKADSQLISAENHGWRGNANIYFNYTMPCRVRLNAYGGCYSPWIDLQSKGSSGYNYGLGLSRSFLRDEALTVSLNAGNFLTSVRRSHYTQQDQTVILRQTFKYKPWNVGLSISWKIGGLKADVRKTSAVIEKESSSGSGNRQVGK